MAYKITLFLSILYIFSLEVSSHEKPLLSIGLGAFDLKHAKYRTTEYRIEYRPSIVYHTIRPTVGVMINRRASVYFYGGFGLEWFIKSVFFSPNFAVGLYGKNQGKDLGFPIEFRSGVELGFRFSNANRVGVHFYHISNARKLFHWSRRNPGSESLIIYYSFAL